MQQHVLAKKRLAAYIRVSSDKQDGTRQRQNIQAWAERHGLLIEQWFDDTHGKNPRDLSSKRLDFQRLLKTVESGVLDAVVVDSLDRFGVKDAWELGYYVHQLRQHGVELWSAIQGNLSAADPATILTSTVGAITSKEEQQEKAHRSLGGKMLASLRGIYTGGYPPFGLDCVCLAPDSKEKWRIVWVGHHRRVKLSPDGSEEVFDGKENVPAKDRQDELRLRPSVHVDRLKVVQQIFYWFVNESISPSQIATRLNELKIDPVFGIAWNKEKIKQLLRNPIYIGYPTSNKRGNGRHKEFVNGQEQPVPQVNGRALTARKREPSDWWQPTEAEFSPIVPKELFEQAQSKIACRSRQHGNPNRKPPRTASFWLRGFVVCAHCGLPMRAWNSPGYRSYFCSSYGTYGKVNPTGCRSNRVKAELIEKIVEDFLDRTGVKASTLLKTSESHIALGIDLRGARRKFEGAWKQMNQFILNLLPEGETELEIYADILDGDRVIPSPPVVITNDGERVSVDDEGFSIFDLYRYLHDQRRNEIMQKVKQKEQEFTESLESFKKLTNRRAIDQANAEMDRIDREINNLRLQLEPIDENAKGAFRELNRMTAAATRARAVLGEANYRRKSEALTGVVDRIECSFRLNDVTAANQPKSLLETVEIIPVTGDPVTCYPNEATAGPG